MAIILGLKTQNRLETAICIQRILTEYGCYIRTRLGLHDVSEGKCPEYAIMLLEIISKKEAILVEKKLLDIDGIEIQRMEF